MTHHPAKRWITTLEASCAHAGIRHLDVIIDQAGSSIPLLPRVLAVDPPLLCRSLYSELPEAQLEHMAPLLVRVDLEQFLHRHWLYGMAEQLHGQHLLLALLSHWPFQSLAKHLGRCLKACNGGYPGMLRYYDPRLFGLLIEVLLSEQREPWLAAAVLWSWPDRDDAPQRWMGNTTHAPEVIAFPPTELSDEQVETLGCAADAIVAMENWVKRPDGWGAERCFRFCHRMMQEATEAGLLVTGPREAFLDIKLLYAGLA